MTFGYPIHTVPGGKPPGGSLVLLHLRSFCKNFVCANHTLARIKVVHLRSVLVLHLRVYFSQFFLAQLLVFEPRC